MSTARALTALARDACARARLVFARGTATDASSSSSSRTVRHRFAVVGSGPAGMYAALALAKTFAGSTIDVFDRSPAPFGLVRYGVAPDHAETKLVTKKFHETLTTREDVAYYGNVGLGRDVSVGELMDGYHGVVLACGASGDRRLEVPGEETRRGVLSAREFVAWFNGDPAHGPESETHARVREALEKGGANAHVAVIGVGNVAIDCARVLLKDADALAETDICAHALETLRAHPVSSVSLIGRRGVAQASFTPKELRELLNLPDVRVEMSEETLALAPEDEEELTRSRPRRRAYEAFTKRKDAGECLREDGGCKKTLHVRFLASPLEFGGDKDGALRWMKLGRNELVGPAGARKSIPSGETETIPTALALRSVGYRAEPIASTVDGDESSSGVTLPFDERARVVPNAYGAVIADALSLRQIPRLYVTGWLKRGPTGIIGTNLTCAEETVAKMAADFAVNPPEEPLSRGVASILARRGVRVVDADDWNRLDDLERARGEAVGKPREKFTRVRDMLDALA